MAARPECALPATQRPATLLPRTGSSSRWPSTAPPRREVGSWASYVVRVSGPNCDPVETLLIDSGGMGTPEQPSLSARLEAETMAEGTTVPAGTRHVVATFVNGNYDLAVGDAAWTVDALGDDELRLSSGPGLLCPDGFTPNSDNSDCTPFTEATILLLPSPVSFDVAPLCQDSASTNSGNCFVNSRVAEQLPLCP